MLLKDTWREFYDFMKYPRTNHSWFGQYLPLWTMENNRLPITVESGFFREEECWLLDEYRQYISRFGWLWRSLPFVEAIYLCNSITFNALKQGSDIDLLIVTRPGYIWITRLMSWLFMIILWIKNWSTSPEDPTSKAKKFCLSFYVDQQHQNLYQLAVKPQDPYLVYWLLHLVPLYYYNSTSDYPDMYQENAWIKNYVTWYTWGQIVDLNIDIVRWSNWFKEFFEKVVCYKKLWRIWNQLIKVVWLPILYYKIRRIGTEKSWWIIVGDTMLKFHVDLRKRYAFQFKKFIQEINKP